MKISHIKLYGILIFVLTLSLINLFLLNNNVLNVMNLILFITIIIVRLLLGYEKIRTRYFKDSVITVLLYTMTYYIIIYLIGLFIGYLSSGYSNSLEGILKNVVPYMIYIFLVEVLRYSINKKSSESSLLLVLATLTFILLDSIVYGNLSNLNSSADILKFLSLSLFPAISRNILLSYTVTKVGYIPNIIYRFIMELAVFILPITPDFGEYLYAVIMLVYPLGLMGIFYRMFNKNDKNKNKTSSRNKKVISRISVGFMIIILIITVILTSGIFKYFALSIGSGSMEKEIEVGDVVIVKKLSEKEKLELEVGEILVFKRDDIIVVHRIVEIENFDDELRIITKGDNNENNDNWVVVNDDIIGTTSFKIKYIGLPTIWLNNAIR